MPDVSDMLDTYASFRPTCFDAAGYALADRADWYVLPVGVNRDSDTLARSNWRVALARLKAACPDGEGPDTYEVHRFGHWACGWFEVALVNPACEAAVAVAVDIAVALAGYPILSEEDFSDAEEDAARKTWQGMTTRDRIRTCARYKVSIFAARREDYPDNDTGELRDYLAR